MLHNYVFWARENLHKALYAGSSAHQVDFGNPGMSAVLNFMRSDIISDERETSERMLFHLVEAGYVPTNSVYLRNLKTRVLTIEGEHKTLDHFYSDLRKYLQKIYNGKHNLESVFNHFSYSALRGAYGWIKGAEYCLEAILSDLQKT